MWNRWSQGWPHYLFNFHSFLYRTGLRWNRKNIHCTAKQTSVSILALCSSGQGTTCLTWEVVTSGRTVEGTELDKIGSTCDSPSYKGVRMEALIYNVCLEEDVSDQSYVLDGFISQHLQNVPAQTRPSATQRQGSGAGPCVHISI